VSALPRLSLRLHGGLDARRSVALAVVAERAGLATVWFAENPFQRGVLPAMAACAVATQRVRLGIGVFNPYNRHPTLIAMETGALDELSDGRVVLGVGSGIGARVRAKGLAYDRPIAAVRDTVAIVRPLLRGEEVTYTGKVFSAHGITLEYRPVRAGMPILMAAMGDQALRLCGEVADGLMVSNGCAPGYTQRAVALVRAGAARIGRPAPEAVVQYVPCAVRDDGDAARREARTQVGVMLHHYWHHGDSAPGVRAAHLEHNGIAPDDFARAMGRLAAGEGGADVLDDRFLRAYAIAGTPDECLEQCAAFARAGVTELGLTFLGGEPEADMVRLGRAAGLA
jgi:5,10-methylenetetrahydromethanopterin reductase